MKEFLKKMFKKEDKIKNQNVDPNSGFIIENNNNEWIKNRVDIRKRMEEQKSDITNKKSKVGTMDVCLCCGFVINDSENYWIKNRDGFLKEKTEKRAKDADQKAQNNQNILDGKSMTKAAGKAIVKEIQMQENIKTTKEIGDELLKLHQCLNELANSKK